MRILVVEDDVEIAALLKRLLERNGYTVDVQHSLKLAMRVLSDFAYSAIILDRGLPDGDGISLIHELRKLKKKSEMPPFIIVSAIGELHDRVEGLDAGAVDYVVKPYEPKELLARLRVCLRLKAVHQSSEIEIGNIIYDSSAHRISVNGTPLNITRRGLLIFDVLAHNVGRVVSSDELENKVYGYEEIGSNALTSQISRLRKALVESNSGVTIKVMRHIGYTLETTDTTGHNIDKQNGSSDQTSEPEA